MPIIKDKAHLQAILNLVNNTLHTSHTVQMEEIVIRALHRLNPSTEFKRFEGGSQFDDLDYTAWDRQTGIIRAHLELRCRDMDANRFGGDIGLNLRKYQKMLALKKETGIPCYFVASLTGTHGVYSIEVEKINPTILSSFRNIKARPNHQVGPNDDEACIRIFLPWDHLSPVNALRVKQLDSPSMFTQIGVLNMEERANMDRVWAAYNREAGR